MRRSRSSRSSLATCSSVGKERLLPYHLLDLIYVLLSVGELILLKRLFPFICCKKNPNTEKYHCFLRNTIKFLFSFRNLHDICFSFPLKECSKVSDGGTKQKNQILNLTLDLFLGWWINARSNGCHFGHLAIALITKVLLLPAFGKAKGGVCR